MDGDPRLLSLRDGTAMVWMETAGYAGGLTPASIVANGKSTAMVPIEGGEYGQMCVQRVLYGA
jgi:hypothetical protein